MSKVTLPLLPVAALPLLFVPNLPDEAIARPLPGTNAMQRRGSRRSVGVVGGCDTRGEGEEIFSRVV
jgi:hypothetical protein